MWEQPAAVSYLDIGGRRRFHTFDFLVFMKNGQRRAIAVKPESRVQSSRIEQTLAAINEQMPRDFADRAYLFTETQIRRGLAANGKLILRHRRSRNEEDMDAVKRVLQPLHGPIRIREVMEKTGMKARAFGAIVCLFDDGVVNLVDRGPINEDRSVVLAQPMQLSDGYGGSP